MCSPLFLKTEQLHKDIINDGAVAKTCLCSEVKKEFLLLQARNSEPSL